MGFQSAINKSIASVGTAIGIGSSIDKLRLKERKEEAMDRMRELQIAKMQQNIDALKARGESEEAIRKEALLAAKEKTKQERAKTRAARARARQVVKRGGEVNAKE
ncbi:MAG: hypothetical protein J6S85_16020 [Methanobrevibacter sp.]|nr:hypothetical protein [Methanobrevibacter sp.]